MGGDFGMEYWRASKRDDGEPPQKHSFSRLCVSFIYFFGFLLLFCGAAFLVPSCLDSTGSDWVWTLGSPAWSLLSIPRVSESAQAQGQVHLRKDGLDIFHKKRATVNILCEESQIGVLQLRNHLGNCRVLNKCYFSYIYGINYMLQFTPPLLCQPTPPASWVSVNRLPIYYVPRGKRLGWHFFEHSLPLYPIFSQTLSPISSVLPKSLWSTVFLCPHCCPPGLLSRLPASPWLLLLSTLHTPSSQRQILKPPNLSIFHWYKMFRRGKL